METFFFKQGQWEKIEVDALPKNLFWLNYFSNDQVSEADIAKMVALGGKAVHTQAGQYIFFSDYPWKANLDLLWNLNHTWQARG